MPWKERYTISDERGMTDDMVRWPEGRRCCVNIVVDLSPPCGPDGLTPNDLATPDAHYGWHGGLDALRALLMRFGLRATFAVPAALAGIYPDTLRAIQDEGHEIAAHGFLREDVSTLDSAEEKRRLDRTTEILATAIGSAPAGWFSLPRRGDKFAGGAFSADTVAFLAAAGYRYLGNGLADDIPHYWVTDFASRSCLLAMPYYYHADDQFFLLFPSKGTGLENPEALSRNWRAEFAAQYRRGRHFNMTLHPYAIGWPNRLLMLEQFLEYLRGFPLVWNPTSAECAAYWSTTFPPATHLHLEPSIWQDHEGSLS